MATVVLFLLLVLVVVVIVLLESGGGITSSGAGEAPRRVGSAGPGEEGLVSCSVQGRGWRKNGRVGRRGRVRGWREWTTTRDRRYGRSSALKLPSSSPSLPGHDNLMEREEIDVDIQQDTQ